MASSCAGFYHDATEQNHGARQGNEQADSIGHRTYVTPPQAPSVAHPRVAPPERVMRTYEDEPVCYAGQ